MIEGAAQVSGYTLKRPVPLEPWLYLAALALFAADVLAMLVLSTGLRLRRRAVATSAAILLALTLLPHPSLASEAEPPAPKSTGNAADEFALKASLKTRLAYVITGDADIDRTSEEGLEGLSKVLRARTALEPGDPMGIDIDKDELAFFPVLYWPVREDVAAAVRCDARQGRRVHEAGRPHHLRHARPGRLGRSIPARRARA